MKRYLLIVLDALLPALALTLASFDVVPEWRLPRNLLVMALIGVAVFISFYLIRWFYYEILLPEPTKSNRNRVLLISVLIVGTVFTLSFVSLFRILIPKSYAEKDGVRELVDILEPEGSEKRFFIYEYTTKPEARRVYILLSSKEKGFVMEYEGLADFPADTAYLDGGQIVVEQLSTGTSQRFETN
jgi:hypothetical protein